MASLSRQLAFPFHVGPDGRIAYVEDPFEAAVQRIVQLILTRPGERVMLPTFGTPARDAVFDNLDPIRATELGLRISSAIQQWEPAAVLHDLVADTSSSDDGLITFNIRLSVPPRTDVFSTLVTVGGAITDVTHG